MRRCKRVFILFYGLFETFVFTGNIFGWTALHYMLREEGIYEYLCEPGGNSSFVTSVLNTEWDDKSSSKTFSNFIVSAALGEFGDQDFYQDYYYPNYSLPLHRRSPVKLKKNVSAVSGVTKGNTGTKRCDAQDRLLNLAFTIGSFCIGSTAFVWGFLLEKWGLRYARLFINGLVTTGTVLLSLTGKDTSYLVFPALILMCLAGVPLRLVNMQIANLFPKQRATIITLYSGAFSASASVFVFIKYGYDAGLPWEWVCFLLVVLSVLMLPVTLFLLPAYRVEEPGDEYKKGLFFSNVAEVAGITPTIWGKFTLIPGSPDLRKRTDVDVVYTVQTKVKPEDGPKKVESEEQVVPLRESLFSVSYLLHQYWFCWLLLYTIIYVGTLHLWIERISDDKRDAAMFSEIYGLFQATGLFLAPLGGVFMDWSVQQASKEPEPEVRRLHILRSAFWPMIITTSTEAVVQVCKFFNIKLAVYISIVFVTLLRAFFIAIGTAYLRIRFPATHFSKLLGIMSTMSSLFTLLQFPLFLWETSSPNNVLYVNIFDTLCLVIAFIHPVLLYVTPLQKHFIKKEKELAEKYSSK